MNRQIDHRRKEIQQIVRNACDQMNQAGVEPRNYVEQLAWLFFLKAFDETEPGLKAVFRRGILFMEMRQEPGFFVIL